MSRVSEKKILYISYDGMTDPLGQSQVIPYLIGLTRFGLKFTILSFEKKQVFSKLNAEIKSKLSKHSIEWVPLNFTTRPPLLAKFYDSIRMRLTAKRLHKKYNFSAVHCRSYPSSEIGLIFKRRFGTKFIFDMRGFWADEKKDGGSWNVSNPFYYLLYRFYKQKEAQFLSEADAIVCLTQAGLTELKKWSSFNSSIKTHVIPCCADESLFSVRIHGEKEAAKQQLGISFSSKVISYLGSLGTWYMLEEMLLFFKVFKASYPDSVFLFITQTPESYIYDQASRIGLTTADICIIQAQRNDVPFFVKASDFSLSFIKPVYSKISSSPTKLGELLLMGIPVVVNAGIGDVEEIVNKTNSGIIIRQFNQDEFSRVVEASPEISNKSANDIRLSALSYYSIEFGIQCYLTLYRQLLTD
jgi:glycosyltransferase involved in cell wall biosynthesis